jgi:hypothetical protein
MYATNKCSVEKIIEIKLYFLTLLYTCIRVLDVDNVEANEKRMRLSSFHY